jgi:hypothetical protein
MGRRSRQRKSLMIIGTDNTGAIIMISPTVGGILGQTTALGSLKKSKNITGRLTEQELELTVSRVKITEVVRLT